MRRIARCCFLVAVFSVAFVAVPTGEASQVSRSLPIATQQATGGFGSQSIVSTMTTFAQTSDDNSGGSTRVRTRGIGKLIGLVVVGVLALGRFVFKLFRGGE